jgi:hypothetical protein
MIWSSCVFIFKEKTQDYANRLVLSLPVKNTEAKLHRWRNHESTAGFTSLIAQACLKKTSIFLLCTECNLTRTMHLEEQRLNSDMVLISYGVIINY